MKIFNANIIGTNQLSGSLGTNLTQSFFTGSLFGTASYAATSSYIATSSWALNAITASYVATSSWALNAVTASHALTAISASYASTSSYVLNANSASYAATASSSDIFKVREYIDFVTQSVDPALLQGRLFYDGTDHALAYYNSASLVHIGQENVIRVRNNTGVALNKGQVVKITGAQGDRPSVSLAQSTINFQNGYENTNLLLGVVSETILNGQDGFVVTQGTLTDLSIFPTAQYTAGDRLYVSSSAGEITNVRPLPPYDKMFIGIVTVASNGGAGKMMVRPIGPLHFHDISEVSASSNVAYGDLMIFDSSSQYWVYSKLLSGSYSLSGSINISQGITGSLFGTSSWSNNTVTASYSLTASYLDTPVVSASYASTSSWAINAITASYIATSSWALNAITASYVATSSWSTNAVTASYVVLAQTASYVTLAQTASYVATSSWSNNAITASYIATASWSNNSVTSSYAATASYVNGSIIKNNIVVGGSFSGNPKKATVTFSTAFPNTNYTITITGEDVRTWTYESKLAGSFVINSNSNTALIGTASWQAMSYGEFNG
jgi:hypothetical protein